MEAKEWLSFCDAHDCPRNAECKRYIDRTESDECVYNIKTRCFERNNYQYFERMD